MIKKNKVVEVYACSEYIHLSVNKARRVIDQIRGRSYAEALRILALMPYRACEPILKLVSSAADNASHNMKINKTDLIISKAEVNRGTIRKKLKPRARGHSYPIKRTTCRITIVLKDVVKVRRKVEIVLNNPTEHIQKFVNNPQEELKKFLNNLTEEELRELIQILLALLYLNLLLKLIIVLPVLADMEKDSINMEKDSINMEDDSINMEKDSINREKDSINMEDDSINMEKDSINREKDSINREDDSINMEKDSINREKDSINMEKDSINWKKKDG
nr:ribosomal protein L22 [Corydalis pauciovulata]